MNDLGVNRCTKSYKLKKGVAEEFAWACEKEGVRLAS